MKPRNLVEMTDSDLRSYSTGDTMDLSSHNADAGRIRIGGWTIVVVTGLQLSSRLGMTRIHQLRLSPLVRNRNLDEGLHGPSPHNLCSFG